MIVRNRLNRVIAMNNN